MNFIIKKITIFALPFLILFIISCSDDFDSIIKSENQIAGTGTNIDNLPLISFASSTSYTLNENEIAHKINILLSETSDDIISATVADTLSGSATAETDYTLTDWSTPEIITFNPGETLKTISITPIQDSIIESTNNTIFLELSAPTNANLGLSSHQVIIYDDDSLPSISFEASSSYSMDESEISHSINFVLSESSPDVISVTVRDLGTGSAQAGTDYNYTGWSSPEIITFNPGETLKTINITPIQDAIDEGVSENINLELIDPVNAVLGLNSHQMLIYDDDTTSIPSVSFALSTSVTANESSSAHDINIILSPSSGSTVTVTITDPGTGSAVSGTDYNLTGWTSPEIITFNAGETLKTVSITPIQDIVDEGTGETINLELSSPTNAVLGTSMHTITITDDDGWIKIGDVATPRAGAAVALEGDWLYIYGGETYSGIALDDFWRYNLSTGEYEILASNGERAYSTLVNLNGNLYRFGGRDTAGTVYDDQVPGIYYYDTSTSMWNSFNVSDTLGPWPVERSHHIAIPVYNAVGPVEKIYFNGGKDSTGTNVSGDLSEIDFLSTPDYRWSHYTISHVRSEHSAVYYNGYIYFFGGYDSGTYYNDLWRFNTGSPAFSEVEITGITIIPERSGISMIEHNGRFYVFGGFDGTDCLDDLWYYSGGSWTKISTAPFKRCFYSAVKYNNSLIVFGGYYINASFQKVYSSEIWQYNLD